jgi:hypothetical protein
MTRHFIASYRREMEIRRDEAAYVERINKARKTDEVS